MKYIYFENQQYDNNDKHLTIAQILSHLYFKITTIWMLIVAPRFILPTAEQYEQDRIVKKKIMALPLMPAAIPATVTENRNGNNDQSV